jgi:hypothetical protein
MWHPITNTHWRDAAACSIGHVVTQFPTTPTSHSPARLSFFFLLLLIIIIIVVVELPPCRVPFIIV